MKKIHKEASDVAKRLGAKRVMIVAIFKNGDVQSNVPIIDESSGKSGAIRRMTLILPTK